MTSEQTNALIFKDQAGEYYLLPQATLERGRVPAEQKAVLEQAIAAAHGGADEDTQGFLFLTVPAVLVGYYGTKAIIEGSRDEPGKTVGEYHAQMLGIGEGITGRPR